MKKTILILFVFTALSCSLQSQNKTLEKEVKAALQSYIHAGDINDANALQPLLSDNFRVVLFDAAKQGTSVLDKNLYTSFIRDKKFGGYTRTSEYHAVNFVGENMATVQITLISPGKPTLKNFYSLVREKGTWKVLQDFVTLVK